MLSNKTAGFQKNRKKKKRLGDNFSIPAPECHVLVEWPLIPSQNFFDAERLECNFWFVNRMFTNRVWKWSFVVNKIFCWTSLFSYRTFVKRWFKKVSNHVWHYLWTSPKQKESKVKMWVYRFTWKSNWPRSPFNLRTNSICKL